MSVKEKSTMIRLALKKAGFNARQVSVKADCGGYDMQLSDNDFLVLEAPKPEIDEEDVRDLRRAFSMDARLDVAEIASQLENKEIARVLRGK